MKHRTPRFIKVACVLTLVSLALICFAIVHPAPLAVIAAMSVGQGVGTIAVGLFGLVALRDIKPIFRSRRSTPPPPPPASKAEVAPLASDSSSLASASPGEKEAPIESEAVNDSSKSDAGEAWAPVEIASSEIEAPPTGAVKIDSPEGDAPEGSPTKAAGSLP